MTDFATLFTAAGDTPTVFFVCGCDGVGKSSLIRQAYAVLGNYPCIDTEEIAQAEGQHCMASARIAIARANDLLAANASFVRVSTLSSQYDFRFARLAQKAGFQAVLVYIGVVSAEIALKRIRQRVSHGGQEIAESIVRRHYERSIGNLQKGIATFDRVVLLDNTSPEFKEFARFVSGKLDFYAFCPAWFRGIQKERGYRFTGIYG